ncbi:MAG TPA: FkbM family methyltransferase [Candidatus Absconditabacterales bacterium]|nr:FkbM family methyltransferase [Candidatus Absconditabacterales bacterium]
MIERFFFMIQGRGYVIKSHNSRYTKFRLLLQSFFLTISAPFLDIIGIKGINVGHGLTLYGFNASFINGLFHENRIHNEYFFKSTNTNPIIIDAGSNIGDSMLYFKYLYPESTIYCFEPDHTTFQYLKKNIINNKLSNVFAEEKALGGVKKTIEFYFDEKPSYTHSTKKGRMVKNKKIIECVGIIDLIKNKKIDLLKLDIEGAELEVIESINTHKLFNNIDQIILEYHHNIEGESSILGSFLSILEMNGYNYQIQSNCFPMNQKNKYQDVHIFAYKQQKI